MLFIPFTILFLAKSNLRPLEKLTPNSNKKVITEIILDKWKKETEIFRKRK